jgi:Cu(I)/Ag(I) efflux system membrane protein CusA/SilA
MTPERLVNEMDAALQLPGLTNSWTMPIRNRIDMLTTGIRTPVGVKVLGPDLTVIEELGQKIEAALTRVPGTRNVFAERVTGGYYFDFEIDRREVARYGLTVGDVQDVIETAIGGKSISMTVEGRERYPVNVRYKRELRDDLPRLERVLVATPTGAQVPLSQLAALRLTTGPPAIKSEDGQLVSLVFVDVAGRDLGGYVEEAKQVVAESVALPPGYTLLWSGQYEFLERAKQRLTYIVPLTLLIIFVLLYLSTHSVAKVSIVLLSVPFSLIGAFWLLYLLHYNLSIAVAVGLIALAGVAVETGVVMLLYLDLAYQKWKEKGLLRSEKDLEEAVIEGAVKRLRPKMMTVLTIFLGLLPIMWGTGAGSDVMKRIAAPMVGGVFSSFVLVLFLYPVIYTIWKWNWEVKPELEKEGRL